MLKVEEILKRLEQVPEGYLSPSNSFFEPGNSHLVPAYKKLGAINNAETEKKTPSAADADKEGDIIYCNIINCKLVFDDVATYQSHYNTMHRFVCSNCKKSMPTAHLLDLHISELHDAYFAARVERGERMYQCFVEECKDTFANEAERKDHCVQQHKFPGNYRFNHKALEKSASKMESEYIGKVDAQCDPLPSKAKEPIKTFSFGHQKEKTFQSRNFKTLKSGSTLEDFNLLKNALDTV